MNRKIYDLFENEIRKNNTKYTIYYVKCDCHNLAIRQKGCVNFFRCSWCCTEFIRDQFGDIVKNNS